MSMVGTFDGFTAARLGIYAAQHGLRVTGNNVSNINTLGYTRQRVDQVSLKVGANDMYRSFYDNHVGSGALVTSISQLRDPYLDIRYRNASTDTYHYDTWLAGLQNIATILDEVGKGENEGDGLLYRQLQDLAEKLRAYGNDPTKLNDRLVRNSATSLVALFHNAATELEKRYNETKNEFNENISAVNEILTSIRDLNKSIREAEIHGDTALEMRDERNRQIDALSQYLDIKVEYSFEDVGAGIQVEKLTIKLNDANPDYNVETDSSTLVDGVYATQLSVPEEKPALNMFEAGSEYEYLNNFLYRRAVTEDVAKELGYDTTKLAQDENGLYLIGTNDSDFDDIVTEKNDNYTIQLGKLVNEKGAAWKNSTTRWTEVDDLSAVIANAKFSFPVRINKEDVTGNDLTFTIDGNNVTIPNGATMKDEDIVAAIAAELGKSTKYSNYDISSDGKNIIFTLKDGADPANTELPSLSLTPGNPDWLTIGNRMTAPAKEYDQHGNLIQSVQYVQADDGKWYRLQIDTEHTHEVTLDDNDLRGILQAQREMLTEEGEFSSEKDVAIDESALLKRGIPYYMKSLDLLAQKFAKAYNQLNKGYAYNQDGHYIKEDGTPIEMTDDNGDSLGFISTDGLTEAQKEYLVDKEYYLTAQDPDGRSYLVDENGGLITNADGNPIYVDEADNDTLLEKAVLDVEGWLEKNEGYFKGGDLFTQLDGTTTTGITAANISVSGGWSNGLWNLVPTFEMLFKDDGSGGLTNSTQSSNAGHMIAMIEKSLTYNPRDLDGSDAIGPELFTGSFNDMLSNMMAVQGEDASMTNMRLTNFATTLSEVDYSREGVSGVDLNDEAMNMITFQKAMSASMRVMTTIDEMLDRLINNTGVAGR